MPFGADSTNLDGPIMQPDAVEGSFQRSKVTSASFVARHCYEPGAVAHHEDGSLSLSQGVYNLKWFPVLRRHAPNSASHNLASVYHCVCVFIFFFSLSPVYSVEVALRCHGCGLGRRGLVGRHSSQELMPTSRQQLREARSEGRPTFAFLFPPLPCPPWP